MNIAIIFKTHIWSLELEKYCMKIYNESKINNIQFYILLHDENNILKSKILDIELKTRTISFCKKDIIGLYESGFISMWLSNHWILMWFYIKYGLFYDYVWSMEYDVKIIGDSSKIWLYDSPHDFLYTKGNIPLYNNKYTQTYIGTKLIDSEKRTGYLQIARYSKKTLNYLHDNFTNGEHAQDEIIIFSLINISGLTTSNIFLSKMIRGIWTWQSRYNDYNRIISEKISINHENKDTYILHPVK